MKYLDLAPASHAAGTVRLPGSKSLSNRFLLLAALAQGETVIRDLLASDDVERMLEALKRLGIDWRGQPGKDYVVPGAGGVFPAKRAELFLGNAGTAFRPLTAALALSGGHYRLSGLPRMHERPIGDLVDALRQLGADIHYLGSEGYPPLEIRPATIRAGGCVTVRGETSSQFLTALLLALPLTGAGATWLAKRLPGRHLLLIIPTAALLTQAWWWQNSLRYLDTTFTPGGFGTPLHYLKSVQQAIGPERDVLIITDGIEILYDQEPAIWTALLHGSASCVRALTGDGRAVFPAGRFAVLIAPNAPPGPVSDLYTTPAEQGFALRPGEGTYRLNRFESAPAWPGPPLAALSPSHFEGGAALTGYALAEGRLYLEWRLPGTLAKDFHYFAHFLNAAGDKLGQRDDLLWPGRFGCPGDRLITWTAVDMPPETTTLRVGLYTLASGGFANAAVVDEAGSPVGTWVDVPIRAG